MSDKRIYDVNLKRPDDTDKEDPKNKQLAIKSSGQLNELDSVQTCERPPKT